MTCYPFVSAHENGEKLSEDELVASTILLLNAGHEATVHQLGNAIRTILMAGGNPRRFVATPEAAAATVEECLRLDAPLHLFTRYVYEDVELPEGVRLKPGEQIGLLSARPIAIRPHSRIRTNSYPAVPTRRT